jgi:hypothetical protein
MSWTATSVCFYCSNSTNRRRQTHVHAIIEHQCANGGRRRSDRNFHVSCFQEFRRELLGKNANAEGLDCSS